LAIDNPALIEATFNRCVGRIGADRKGKRPLMVSKHHCAYAEYRKPQKASQNSICVGIVNGSTLDYHSMLAVALAEARLGLKEGGIPIGAAIFDQTGKLIGAGHNRRVQQGDPSVHGETDAFRNAGRQKSYRKLIMVTTLAPCWYCSGLVRQFGFGTVVVGESRNFQGGIDWLRSLGVQVIDLDSQECVTLVADYIRTYPAVWNEDIGEE
jgi:creatinine deaminase